MKYSKVSRRGLFWQLPAYVKYVGIMTERGMDAIEATLAYMEEPDLPAPVRRDLEVIVSELRRGRNLNDLLARMVESMAPEISYVLSSGPRGSAGRDWTWEMGLVTAWHRATARVMEVTVYGWVLAFVFLSVLSFGKTSMWPSMNQILKSSAGTSDLWAFAGTLPLSLGLSMKMLIAYMNWSHLFIIFGIAAFLILRTVIARGSMVRLFPASRHFYQAISALLVRRWFDCLAHSQEQSKDLIRSMKESVLGLPGPQAFRRAMTRVADALERGESISGAMLESGYFDGEFCYEVALGEESQNLIQALDRIVEKQTEEFSLKADIMARRAEPVMATIVIFLGGGLVAGYYSFLQGILHQSISSMM